MGTALLVIIGMVIAGIVATDIERRRKHHLHIDTAQELVALKLDHKRLHARYTLLVGQHATDIERQRKSRGTTDPEPWCVVLEHDDLSHDYVVAYATDEADAADWGSRVAQQTRTRFVRTEPFVDVLTGQYDGAAMLTTLNDGGF